ncbi:unnamed protein product [Owenia fusiformis]|nr:unnamed protein product [Owenia fusiformis]
MPVPDTAHSPTSPTMGILADNRIPDALTTDLSSSARSKLSMGSPLGKPLFYIDDENSNSQDSGMGFDKDKDDFMFAAPTARPKRSLKLISEDSCSPFKYSPAKGNAQLRPISAPASSTLFDSPEKENEVRGFSLRKSSLVSSPNDDDNDDGFLELWDDNEDAVPSGLSSLLGAPISRKPDTGIPTLSFSPACDEHDTDNSAPKTSKVKLFRSPSAPRLFQQKSQTFDIRSRFKRSEPTRDFASPIMNKRRKSIKDCESIELLDESPARAKLQRSFSMVETTSQNHIKDALSKSAVEPDLIGDCSKTYCLPTIKGRHQDLKSITAETMSKLLNNEYSHVVEKFMIIDCRYPYEYEGGHIKDAKNLYTKDKIIEEFLKDGTLLNQQTPVESSSEDDKRNIIIFHCEFSSERGPKLMRFLRNKDREAHKDIYPALKFPEVYLLHLGYKEFFENHDDQCEPQTYKPMLHENHSQDLKHFRAKSKSWAGAEKQRGAFRPGLKF